MNKDTKIVSVELPLEAVEKLKRLAEGSYRSLSAQLRMIIDDYLEKNNS